jgi:solute carrier family 25 S-adenosylmethionine transporter 26
MGGISQILKADGIGGLFAGYFATLVRDIPYTMLELGLYENIKTMLRKFRGKTVLDQSDELSAAAITGGITSFITTPLDVVKTKLMMQVYISSYNVCYNIDYYYVYELL